MGGFDCLVVCLDLGVCFLCLFGCLFVLVGFCWYFSLFLDGLCYWFVLLVCLVWVCCWIGCFDEMGLID